MPMSMEEKYHPAEICMEGHVKSAKADIDRDGRKFCKVCGGSIIEKCPTCVHQIDGLLMAEDSQIVPYVAPKYCPFCGTAYPWTKNILDKASKLIEETNLSSQEKAQMKISLDTIARNAPGAQTDALRVKEYTKKIGGQLGLMLKDIAVEMASEKIKDILTVEYHWF
jgi:hypothetical protein